MFNKKKLCLLFFTDVIDEDRCEHNLAKALKTFRNFSIDRRLIFPFDASIIDWNTSACY